MSKQQCRKSVGRAATHTIPELEQSRAAVLSTLASVHSRRSYKHATERFISWYCDEPRLAFNRSVGVQYRSFFGKSLALRRSRSAAQSAVRRAYRRPAATSGLPMIHGRAA